jgi:hypothetical protein
MTYDVPVKLFSFHLILMSIFLLAPDMPRLCKFFFSNRETPPPQHPQLFRKPRANRIAVAMQLVFGFFLIGMNIYGGVKSWYEFGGGRPKPDLYGIWNVEDISLNGQLQSPAVTDNNRWRRMIFDSLTYTSFQRMDDTFTGYPSTIDPAKKTLTFTNATNKNWKANFTYDRPSPGQLVLDGTMDGHTIQMHLELVDRSKLMLVSRGFHWINEYPFQR